MINLNDDLINDPIDEVVIDESVDSNDDNYEEESTITKKRKNKKNTEDNSQSSSDDSIQNAFESFMINTNSGIKRVPESNLVIPTGIDLLDTILGGGIGMKFSQLVGPPGGGKSAATARILSQGQKLYGDKFIGIYADTEDMTKERLVNLGVKNPPIEPYQNAVTVEGIFKIIESLCTFKEKEKLMDIPSVVVWDSVANTPTESIMDSEERTNMMPAQKAAILAYYLPIYCNKMNKYNIALVSVNQIRDELDTKPMFSGHTPKDINFLKSGFKIPGGKSMIHNTRQMLEIYQCGNKKDIMQKYGFNGIRVNITAVRNKLFTPNIPIQVVFNFANGYSNFWTNYEYLELTKYIISPNKGWRCLKGAPQPKFRESEAIELYRTNEEWRKCFDEHVRDALQQLKDVSENLDVERYDV